MPASPMSEVLQYLRGTLLPEEADLTDGQLLECFVSRREPAALEALVRRHAPMVWGVCHRILGNHHDAEDAFQAAFFVLVRKAASVSPRARVGNWLYGGAQQTALKARANRTKRRERERPVTGMPEPAAKGQDLGDDLHPLLDLELSRLPEKYRAVLVLCELEGRTVREAARQLDCPEGTVASRLSRGRSLLAKRLARHGLAVSGGALTALLSQNAAASAPTAVVSATIQAVSLLAAGAAPAAAISVKAAALMEGGLKTMLLTKLRLVAFVVAVLSTVTVGTALLAMGKTTGKDDEAGKRTTRTSPAPRDRPVLASWPPDAPIQLRPRTKPGKLDRREAEAKVRQYLGIGRRKKLGLAPAYLTDTDFPFLRPEKQAVWLAEVRDFPLPAGPEEKKGTAADKPAVLGRLFVALDADTGQLLEALHRTAPPLVARGEGTGQGA